MMSELAVPMEQETTSKKLVTCADCGQQSSTQHRFCEKCGTQLWDPCLGCEEKNPVDVRFCASCGVEVAELIAKAIAEREQALAEARGRAEVGRFLDAMEILQQVPTVDHSQLRELREQIQQLSTEYPKQREEAVANAKAAADEVQSLVDQRKFHAAHRRLLQVPLPLRNLRIRQLGDEIEPKVEESHRLRAAVAMALRNRKFDGLLPKVQRLAELNPDDEKIAKLLIQIQQRQQSTNCQTSKQLAKAAQTAMAKCDYKTARATILRMPECIQEQTVAKAVQDLKERLWLEEQLRTAPHITPTLLFIAERLAKLQPQDKRVAQIHSLLKQRWTQSRRKNSYSPVSWVQAPDQAALGVSVDLLDFDNPFAGDRPLRRDWLVAHGLALQALGKAEINIDLTPQKKQTGWRKLLSLKGSKKKGPRAWGVDIGSSCLKAVQLAVEGETLRVLQTVRLSHRWHASEISPAHSNDDSSGNSKDQAPSVLGTIEQFLGKYDVTNQPVATNLPGTQTLGRFFDIPAPKPNKFDDAVQYELRARIPLQEQESLYDYHWTPIETDKEESVALRHVTLVAANREHVEDRLQGFLQAGVSQLQVQSDCIALYNMIQHCLKAKERGVQAAPLRVKRGTAIVEIGAQTTNWIVLTSPDVWFRGLYVGASRMDQSLATGLQLTPKNAELLRHKPEQAPRMHELHEQLLPEFASIADAFRRTLDQVQRETNQSISQVLLCGGCADQFGLLRYLRLGS